MANRSEDSTRIWCPVLPLNLACDGREDETREARDAGWQGELPDVFPHRVRRNSPLQLRRALEQIARFFQRQFRYDFLQYRAVNPDPKAACYLWEELHPGRADQVRAFGGCCFMPDDDSGWELCWVWFHPYYQGRRFHESASAFAKAWPVFRVMFGDFRLNPPISKAMAGFLAKHGEKFDRNARLIPRAEKED